MKTAMVSTKDLEKANEVSTTFKSEIDRYDWRDVNVEVKDRSNRGSKHLLKNVSGHVTGGTPILPDSSVPQSQ